MHFEYIIELILYYIFEVLQIVRMSMHRMCELVFKLLIYLFLQIF